MEGPRACVWVDGVAHYDDNVGIGSNDRGFTLGDGLFETMLWTGHTIRFFEDHMARLADAASALKIPLDQTNSSIYAGLMGLTQRVGDQQAAVRLTLTRGTGPRGLGLPEICAPCLMASIAVYNAPATPVHIKTVSICRNSSAPSARFKTLSYIDNIIALDQARSTGGDDAVMLGTTGYVACASSANIVLHYRGVNLTPALEDGALPGIVRGRLIKAGLVEEARISVAQLHDCEAAVLTNALMGVRRVSQIDGRLLSNISDWADGLVEMFDSAN